MTQYSLISDLRVSPEAGAVRETVDIAIGHGDLYPG